MLVNPLVEQATLGLGKREARGFLRNFVPELLNQTNLLDRRQLPEGIEDRFCAHAATLRPPSSRVQYPDHPDSEGRFIQMGLSRRSRLVVAAYTERGDRLRIITARLASRRKKRKYEEG